MYRPADPKLLVDFACNQEDVITKPFQDELQNAMKRPCPRCGSEVRPEANIDKILRNSSSRFAYLSRCLGCGCLFDPDLGIIVELGNLGRLEPEIPLIHKEDKDL